MEKTGNQTWANLAGMAASFGTSYSLETWYNAGTPGQGLKGPDSADIEKLGTDYQADDIFIAGSGESGAGLTEYGSKTDYHVRNITSADDVNKVFVETMRYEPPYMCAVR